MADARCVRKAPRRGALLFLALVFAAGPALAGPQTESAQVRAVIDGDTVVLQDGRRVRLIGINTPELARDDRPAEPFAEAARARLLALAGDGRVGLEFESSRRDRHGRELAHLWLADGQLAQEALLADGLGVAIAVTPNIRHLERYLAAESGARRARLGLWADPWFAARAANALTAADRGFRFVAGEVIRVGRSRRYVYLDFTRTMSVTVAVEDWERYFGGTDPRDWRGRRLEARGWLRELDDGRLRMQVHHPRMLAPRE